MVLFGEPPREPACKDDLESSPYSLAYVKEVGGARPASVQCLWNQYIGKGC
jgi:hypothetical protein